jgi:SAM-dependent methyltransferase
MAAATTERRRPDEEKVRAHWNETLPPLESTFYGFPPLRPYLYRCITGRDPTEPLDRDWFERWAVTEILGGRAPVASCLSLCCGFGEIERILARLGAFEHCLGVDLAPEAVAAARVAAASDGIDGLSYQVVDVETVEFEPDTYDLIWANGALHHVARLEHVVTAAYKSLRPGGLLVANEYVGPNHHQLDPRTVELVNAAIHLLPPELRDQTEDTFVPERFRTLRSLEMLYRLAAGRLPAASGARGLRRALIRARRTIPSRRRPFGPAFSNNPWYYRDVDPSEGVRASAIVPILRAQFEEVDVRPYNGSILPHVLGPRFYHAFATADPAHNALLTTLTELEAGLVAAGEIEPHHAAIVCRKAW